MAEKNWSRILKATETLCQ